MAAIQVARDAISRPRSREVDTLAASARDESDGGRCTIEFVVSDYRVTVESSVRLTLRPRAA
ncbi:hypothetical protein [Natrinema gari]|uniref:hypothetical protein n=1 Tax=Natrinema gari TaxID=419186 RepID=UPI00026D466A|nr:hypothetical protein [Natrinema gari]AFO57678.1 hypothetical protein NJ7G_2445 [Natrinema sp. J7-2]